MFRTMGSMFTARCGRCGSLSRRAGALPSSRCALRTAAAQANLLRSEVADIDGQAHDWVERLDARAPPCEYCGGEASSRCTATLPALPLDRAGDDRARPDVRLTDRISPEIATSWRRAG